MIRSEYRYVPHLLVLCVVGVSILSCSPSSDQNKLQIAGSTTVLPVVSRAAEQFSEEHSNARIVVNAGGSGTGINMLGQGEIDIGMSSRGVTPSERKQFPNVDFTKHVLALDAVLPVVSREIYASGVTSLTRSEIADMYQGDITNWQEVGGPDRAIFVVDKERSRGTRHVFMNYLFGDAQTSAPGADIVLGANNEEQNAIANSNAAIGMLSKPWVNQEVKGLGIERKDGTIIHPTAKHMQNRTFPILRELRVYTEGTPDGLTEEFIRFLHGKTGQEIVEDIGYVQMDQ